MKKIFIGIIFLSTSMLLFSQQVLTPELLWKIGRISDEQVSPSGDKVLFGVTEYDLAADKGSRDLYLLSFDFSNPNQPGHSLKRLTNTAETSEYNARWMSDSKIAFLSAESGAMQIWEMSVDGSGRKQVTDIEDGINDFELSSTGDIVFSKSVKLDKTVNELYSDLPKADARIIDDLMYRHWNAWDDYAYNHVFVMPYPKTMPSAAGMRDLMKDERNDSPVPPFGGSEQYCATGSAASGMVYYSSKKTKDKVEWAKSTNTDIYQVNLATGATKNLTEGMMGYDMEVKPSPDGKYIAWLSMAREGYESDRNRIMVMELATGKRMEVTSGFPHPAQHIAWSKDGKHIFFSAPIEGSYQMFKTEVSNAAPSKVTQLTKGVFNYYGGSVLKNGWLIASRTSMSYPNELYLLNPENGQGSNVSQINAELLKDVKWGAVEAREITTTDQQTMQSWVIYPPDFDPKKKYPTLLYCQGGPQSTVSQFFSFRWNFQLMAANGYIIVAPNRRGLPGFGEDWNEAISGNWGGQAIDDYLSAIDDVAREDYVDKDRLGSVGASYGGYSVYYLAGVHQKRFKAFISHCGLYNLESWYGSTEEMFFANFDVGGPYWQSPQPKSYEAYSPHKFVQNWDTPILVVHGAMDFRVPINQGMEAFNAAKLRGIPAKFLYFPGEGHWVQKPQNGVLWHRVFFEWLDQHLKD